jgi:hypothetical protein
MGSLLFVQPLNCFNELIGSKYVIQNILGEKVFSGILEQNLTTFPTKELKCGIYFLKPINSTRTLKFIKQ